MIPLIFQAIKKSGLAAFFVLCTGSSALAQPSAPADLERRVDALRLDQHRVWSALLHLERGQPQIRDPDFFASRGDFNARTELLATVSKLYGQADAVCRFPARYLWLQSQLSLPPLPLDRCTQWREFRARAPLDTLSLVFVSESVVLPASMMGHAFFKLAGHTPEGQEVAHALSFYTPAETYNLPKLYWQSMVSGKEGIFALAPFEEARAKYLAQEKRNLWLYQLHLADEERLFLQAHMLELKQTQLLYWFHSYNCATLLRNLLALTGRLPLSSEPWETPKDLVKAVSQAGLVDRTEVMLTNEWIVDQMQGSPTQLDAGQRHLRERARLDVLLADQRISPEAWRQAQQNLGTDDPISLAPALDPAQAPPDAQWRLSVLGGQNESRVRLTFIPLSHQFLDKQAHSISETELEFMSVALSWGQTSHVRLDQLNIYAMRSLNPWNPTTRRWSSEFRVGYDQLASHSRIGRGMLAHLALGATLRPLSSMDVYGLTGLSRAKGMESQETWHVTEAGLVTRFGGNTKAAWSVKSMRAMGRSHEVIHQQRWGLTHSTSVHSQVFFHLTQARIDGHSEKAAEWGFKYLF